MSSIIVRGTQEDVPFRHHLSLIPLRFPFFLLRLLQHIIKNPCDVRAALLSGHKLNDDYSAPSAELLDEDTVNRFKRELEIHQ
jgi:hypothetical protein